MHLLETIVTGVVYIWINYEIKKITKKWLNESAKLDWQFDIVSMCTLSTDVIRVRNKNKGKRGRNKNVDSKNSIEWPKQ